MIIPIVLVLYITLLIILTIQLFLQPTVIVMFKMFKEHKEKTNVLSEENYKHLKIEMFNRLFFGLQLAGIAWYFLIRLIMYAF